MKILQVNKYHYPRGGADRYYLDLGSRLEALGHQVAYFAMKHPKNLPSPWSRYFISRVSYNEQAWRYALKIPGRAIYSLEAKRKFSKLLKEFRPDVIHIHNIYHQLSPSILDVAAKFKIPVVMHVHDYKLVCPNHALFVNNQVCEKCLKKNYWPAVKNNCVKNSRIASLLSSLEMYLHHTSWKIYEKNISVYLTPSLFLKNILIKSGWPSEKILVVNNAFSAGLPTPLETQKEDYFLYFGRLSSEKGVDLAIKASGHDPRLKLKIVGNGPDELSLKTLDEKSIREGRVEFLGWCEGVELSTLISQAKATIIPSRWYENFPLTALESLSLGTPVIASDIGGLPEIVTSKNGILVPPDDIKALHQAMLDILLEKMRWPENQIRESAQHFLPEVNTNTVLTIYQNLINQKNTP